MMNTLKILITLLLLYDSHEVVFFNNFADTHLSKKSSFIATMQSSPTLRLKIKVAEQRYCKSQVSRKTSLLMKLQLNYTNVGEEPIILYKSSSDIIEFMISRNLENMTIGQFDVRATQTAVTDGMPLHVDDLSPGKFFAIVSPGKSFEVRSELSLEVLPNNNDTSLPSILATGKHYLQIRVATWPMADASVANLRERWKNIGVLWSDSVISLPIQFTVEKQSKIPLCKATN